MKEPGELHWIERPTQLFGDTAALGARAPGLERAVFDETSTTPRRCDRLGTLAASTAAFAALSGDYVEARRLAAVAQMRFVEQGNPNRGNLLQAAIELHAGAVPAARALVGNPAFGLDRYEVANLLWIADLRNGHALERPPRGIADMWHRSRMGEWDLAPPADGVALARWVQGSAAAGALSRLAAAIPQLDRGRAELREWLRWGVHASCWTCPPEQVGFDAARRRDAAEALGEHALAAELDATATAFRKAMLRRDISVPLAVLSTL